MKTQPVKVVRMSTCVYVRVCVFVCVCVCACVRACVCADLFAPEHEGMDGGGGGECRLFCVDAKPNTPMTAGRTHSLHNCMISFLHGRGQLK